MGFYNGVLFDTPDGREKLQPSVTILAFGGGSWRRLGSDGSWANLPELESFTNPFLPSNVGLSVRWSDHMESHFGQALKAVAWRVEKDGTPLKIGRGEAIISARGLEGGGIYPLVPALRNGGALFVDLAPDVPIERLTDRFGAAKNLSRFLRNALRFPKEKIALFHEFRDASKDVVQQIKHLPIAHDGPRSLDEAISTAGGLRRDALDDGLMLKTMPGVFCLRVRCSIGMRQRGGIC